MAATDAAAMLATILHAPLGTTRIDAATAQAIATAIRTSQRRRRAAA